VRNLRANPRLMVAVGDPRADFNVGLIEASAELALPATTAIPDAFFAKYARELADARFKPAAFRATYTQAVRIEPTRFVAWHGRGVTSPATAGVGPSQAPRLATVLATWLDQLSARLRGLGAGGRTTAGAAIAA
jgi:hypothetical protein